MTTYLSRPVATAQLLPQVLESVRTTRHDVSRRARRQATGRPHSDAPAVTGRTGEGPTVPAPAKGTAPTLTSAEVLRTRRSQRFYDDGAIPLDDLTTCLIDSLDSDARLWPMQPGTAPQIVVAALRVDDLSPGLYRFDRRERCYTRLAHLRPEDVADMVLQTEFGDAAVIVAAMGSLSSALSDLGDHGQRILNVRAAGVCYGALLQAGARRIAGSVFAGFLPSGLSRLVNADGYHLAQVFAVSLGHVAPAPGTSTASPVEKAPVQGNGPGLERNQ